MGSEVVGVGVASSPLSSPLSATTSGDSAIVATATMATIITIDVEGMLLRRGGGGGGGGGRKRERTWKIASPNVMRRVGVV